MKSPSDECDGVGSQAMTCNADNSNAERGEEGRDQG